MPNYQTDDGICLRVTDFSETSQIVGIFTRTHGIQPLIAKGAKRASKKNAMSGPLDLLTSGEVVFIPAKETAFGAGGHQSQLGTLAGWDLSNHRRDLRSNLAAVNAGMLCAEVTTHLLHPHDPHEELFAALQAALDLLATPAQRARALVSYVKAALVAAGYWPQFHACLICGRPIGEGPVRFSPRQGGIFCGSRESGCLAPDAGATITVPGLIAIALERLPLPEVLQANPPDRPADEAALLTAMQLLLAHVEMLTDKPLRTHYLLRTLFGTDPRAAATPPIPSLPQQK